MIEYENLYANLQKKKASLLMTSIQISEFINTCIRFQFKLYQDENTGAEFKKDYRNTNDYRDAMNSILEIVESDIIPNFEFIDDGFREINRDNIFQYGISYDFNDAILSEIAKNQKASLVTHDADYINYAAKVEIVTNNSKLLMFS